MFGLSSQQILQEKLKGRTEGFEFETAFYRFVFEELTNIAVNAAAGEYELAAARVQELIALGQSNVAGCSGASNGAEIPVKFWISPRRARA